MSDERIQSLESLVQSPGWAMFVAFVGSEWGPKAYAQKLKSAVSGARERSADPVKAIEVVDETNEAVAALMRWPGDELGRLKRASQTPEVTMSRRGGL